MTKEEMLRRIGSSEITEWAAIFSVEAEEEKKRQEEEARKAKSRPRRGRHA